MDNRFDINLSGDQVSSNSNKAFSLQDFKKIGEKSGGKVVYSKFEALYLFETDQARIKKQDKILSESEIIRTFSKEKDFMIKYSAFKALRKKGYIVKTGSKFGAEFRVYDRIINHARWICYPVKEKEKTNWHEFIAKSRISHSTGKKLLLAIVDSENNVLFYETDWIKI